MNSLHIGMTGTRSGMTPHQRQTVKDLLHLLILTDIHAEQISVHHGDCVGADEEFAQIAQSLGCKTICHPPLDNRLRAWHNSDEILAPKSYFARNRDIVDASSMLVVIPWQMEWQSNGGTWYTHDYAVKQKKLRFMVWPEKTGKPAFLAPEMDHEEA